MVRLGLVALAALLAGCAGRSIDTEEAGGTSGAGGANSGGGGGRGGTSTGGSGGSGASGGGGGAVSSGGSGGTGATGGSLQGGSGGSVTTGGAGGSVSVGGATMGGTGGNAMAGAAGAGSVCGLPLDPGPCSALGHAYGFDSQAGQCVQFVYGGCQGNENNFPTLADCEAACLGPSVRDCPAMHPGVMTPCSVPMQKCTYDWQSACLCASNTPYVCTKVDPECPPVAREVPQPDGGCTGDDCVADIRVPPNQLCECGGSGIWECASAE